MMNLKEEVENYNDKEWPGIEEDENCITIVKPKLFIMELGRLVPYLEGEHVRFFPINMPKIQIGCTRIIGLVLHVSCSSKEYRLIVDDGTGILTVKHSLKHFGTMQNEDHDEVEDSQNNQNSQNNIKFVVGNYVDMQGYLSLTNYNKAYENCEDENPLEILLYGLPVFYAVNIEIITEQQYYEKMNVWLNAAEKRYISKES